MTEEEHFTEFVNGFLLRNQRRRFLVLAESDKGRDKITGALAHSLALDERHAQRVPPSLQTQEYILRSLRDKGAGATCYAISEHGEIDGKIVPLEEALSLVFGWGLGTVLSCIPGKLAYYEGEEANCRYILEKQAKK